MGESREKPTELVKRKVSKSLKKGDSGRRLGKERIQKGK